MVLLSPPSDELQPLFDLPNTRVVVVERSEAFAWRPFREQARLLAQFRPSTVHLLFTAGRNGYLWLAKWYSTEKVFLTDRVPRSSGHCPTSLPMRKRLPKRVIYCCVHKLICLSDFVRRCLREDGVLPVVEFSVFTVE